MKQKAKKAFKHKVQLFGKTVPTVILVGLLLAGTGSAALLTTFGTVSGTADVDQAVYLENSAGEAVTDNNLATDYAGEVVAGSTYTETFTVANDANVSAKVGLESNASEITGIEQGVYTSSSYSETLNFKNGDTGTFEVTVTPNGETVNYTVNLPKPMDSGEELFALEVSEAGTTLGQVYYGPAQAKEGTNSDGFAVKMDGSFQSVGETDFVLDTARSEDKKTVSFTVENQEGEQKFGLRGDYNDANEGETTPTELENGPFYIPDSFEGEWGNPSAYTEAFGGQLDSNLEGQSVTVPAEGSKSYILSTDFALNLKPQDGYTVGVEVEPDTSQEEIKDWDSTDGGQN